ncbi:EAL domain-containing protein [Bacillus sp. CGMCC 1.16607]|uniref:bifunctional diguanylate cyclase/phosphodiesterase n=1 Tax=Bacillus sp. CGMCC 1.16607 TaxID=3351842 RepID=UPI00362B3B51
MFSIPESADVTILQGEFSPSIVLLSIFIACCASYTALSMNERIQQNSFFHRNFWLALASIAMGFGIWSMHFIGMSAFMLPVNMKYDPLLTILSVIPAILASFIAFFIANRTNRFNGTYIFAGIIMGLGISIMHYLGMAAMQMEADYVYKPWIFASSIFIAILVSLVALFIFSKMQRYMTNRLFKGITAIVMGGAVASMHYTGMAAIVFYVNPNTVQVMGHMHNMDMTLLVTGVTVGITILLGLSGLSSVLDKYVDYRLNYFDALTKLSNRRQFENILMSSSSSSLAILHIHGLEKWNSDFGYEFGDDIIRTVGELLLRLKPVTSQLFRVEGNQFALVTSEQKEIAELKTAVERVASILTKPIVIKDHRIIIETVCAISSAENEERANQLFSNANAVLQHPSITYNHEVIEYDPAFHTYTFERQIAEDIERGMNNGELFLVYQPKVSAKEREIIGLEALLRWNHSVYGFLSPAIFIPILEQNGKMFDVTDWVIDQACQTISNRFKNGLPIWQVAVNIPGPYITTSRLKEKIKFSVEKYGIESKYLELEITETSVVSNIESAIKSVHEIRKDGFSVALDDFGTGVSSLSYLKRLPISTLKIDKSFVDGIPESEKDSAIMKAIITLCFSLNLNIIIEGVETDEQYQFLSSMPENLSIQGYYFAKPLKLEELTEWVSSFQMQKIMQ